MVAISTLIGQFVHQLEGEGMGEIVIIVRYKFHFMNPFKGHLDRVNKRRVNFGTVTFDYDLKLINFWFFVILLLVYLLMDKGLLDFLLNHDFHGSGGHWSVYYTSAQSFIITFSYSLA